MNKMIITNNINDLDNILNNKKVFIFDFDGTLADTELYHWEAYNLCLKEFNIILSEDDIQKYIGNKEDVIYQMIKSDFKIDFNEEEFFKQRILKYFELVEKNNLLPYNFFKDIEMKYCDIDFVIVSSQKLFVIEKILNIWKKDKIFSQIISVSDSHIEKMDVYSDTQKYFNIDQKYIVLFEDSNKYLKMGQDKNIVSIGIEANYNKGLLKNCNAIITISNN